MEKTKQDAIKKLLKLTDKQFEDIQNKVLDNWADNIITTHQQKRSVDDLVKEINETQ